MISKEALSSLELGFFTDVCRVFFSQMGFEAKETDSGSGPDLSRVHILYSKQTNAPLSLFQCHAGNGMVGFEVVNSFHDMIAAVNMTNGYFLSSGKISGDIQEYAAANMINLVDLDKLLGLINKMPEASRDLISEIASRGSGSCDAAHDSGGEVPRCAKCGFRMQFKVTEGKYREGKYWECPNPDCKHIIAFFGEPEDF